MRKETYILRHSWEFVDQDGDQDCDERDYILPLVTKDEEAINLATDLVAQLRKDSSKKVANFFTLFAGANFGAKDYSYREIKTDF